MTGRRRKPQAKPPEVTDEPPPKGLKDRHGEPIRDRRKRFN